MGSQFFNLLMFVQSRDLWLRNYHNVDLGYASESPYISNSGTQLTGKSVPINQKLSIKNCQFYIP